MTEHPAIGATGTMTVRHPMGNFEVGVFVQDIRQRWWRTEYYVKTTEMIGVRMPGMGDADDPFAPERAAYAVMHPPAYAEAWVNAKRVHLSS